VRSGGRQRGTLLMIVCGPDLPGSGLVGGAGAPAVAVLPPRPGSRRTDRLAD